MTNKLPNIIMHFNFGYTYLLKDIMHYKEHYEYLYNALYIKGLSKVLPIFYCIIIFSLLYICLFS